jgi:hypothetical protein
LNMQRISSLLEQYPEQNIVNFSWQAGKVSFTYPDTFHGAYEDEHAIESLRELFLMVNTFQDKLFFAAAGNYGDDIRRARTILTKKGEWPENLVLAAEWHEDEDRDYGYPAADVHGADIYVNPKDLALWGGSTQSTQTMTSLAAYLQYKGLTQAEIKRVLLIECVEDKLYVAEPTSFSFVPPITESARIFSPVRFVEYLSENTDYNGTPYIMNEEE